MVCLPARQLAVPLVVAVSRLYPQATAYYSEQTAFEKKRNIQAIISIDRTLTENQIRR
jgi:hypothetical protein